MRYRISKHKTEAGDSSFINERQKYLVQHCIEMNKNCLTMIKKGQLNKSNQHLEKMMKYIKQMPQTGITRNIKRLTLNTKAYHYQRMKQFNRSLQCLKDASNIQDTSFMEEAKNLLNQCTIQSRMGNHNQAIKLAKQSLQTLRRKQSQYSSKTIYSEICELVVLCFFNIGTQLTHLKDLLQAQLIYRRGFEIAVKHLGVHHQLTLMLKKAFQNIKKQDKMKNRFSTIQKDEKVKYKPNDTKNFINFNKSILSKNRYKFPTIENSDKSSYFRNSITPRDDRKQKMNKSFNPQRSKKFFGLKAQYKQRKSKTRLQSNPPMLIQDIKPQNHSNPQQKQRNNIQKTNHKQTKSVQKKQGCEIM